MIENEESKVKLKLLMVKKGRKKGLMEYQLREEIQLVEKTC